MIDDLSFKNYSPVDVSGTMRSIFRSSYKDLRFALVTQEYFTVNAAFEANLPGISYKFYKTTDLWRVLLAHNGLTDPINDIQVGTILKIPTKASVVDYLTRQVGTSDQDVRII